MSSPAPWLKVFVNEEDGAALADFDAHAVPDVGENLSISHNDIDKQAREELGTFTVLRRHWFQVFYGRGRGSRTECTLTVRRVK